tara:strand:- start:982 stop:1971 length:990 start_codon:yes stop_codon:yes gene_type:complete
MLNSNMNDLQKINIGIIGTGRLGSFHIEQYQTINNINIVGAYDVNNEQLDVIKNKYDITIFNNINELLKQCDAVSIATPTTTHFDIAKKAMHNNCHVLIEKPITKNIQEAQDLVQIAEEKNLIIQVGHIERFNPAFYGLINDKINPKFIESHRLAPFSTRGTDVDVILDLMIHDIDIVLSLVKSNVKEIRASGISVLSDNIDTANARVLFENGCVANMTASRIAQKTIRKFRFFEDAAYTTIDFLNPSIEKYILSNKVPNKNSSYVVMNHMQNKYILYEKPDIHHHNALKKELENFVESIINVKKPIIDGFTGLNALKLAIKILGSIEK